MRSSASFLVVLALLAPLAAEDPRAELARISADIGRLSRAYHLVHEIVAPSVVAIRTRERVATRTWTRLEVREVDAGEGSGFVVHSDDQASWVLTNAHVVVQMDRDQTFVKDAQDRPVGYDRVRVVLWDNREVDAAYAGVDDKADLALLKIPVPRLNPVAWADSDQVHVGDFVVALGYPFGVGYSATFGNVSATDRSTGVYESNGGFESFIQTDAAINPGNSGGPLVDLQARIVGVNANIVSRSGGSVGLGFAIPSNFARRVAEDLRLHGRVQRSMLGVQISDLSAQEARAAGLPERRSVRVDMVFPLSPAAEAGIQSGDVVIGIGGVPIVSRQQFRARIAAIRPGERLTVNLNRGGREFDAAIIPVSTEEFERRLTAAAQQAETLPQGGVVVLANLGLTLGDDHRDGLPITSVQPGSVADRAGLVAGDRVMGEKRLGRMQSAADARVLAKASEATLVIERQDGRTYLVRLSRR